MLDLPSMKYDLRSIARNDVGGVFTADSFFQPTIPDPLTNRPDLIIIVHRPSLGLPLTPSTSSTNPRSSDPAGIELRAVALSCTTFESPIADLERPMDDQTTANRLASTSADIATRIPRTTAPSAKMPSSVTKTRAWNTQNLGRRVGSDIIAATSAGALVAPVISSIDR
jgi:hypothetical protein